MVEPSSSSAPQEAERVFYAGCVRHTARLSAYVAWTLVFCALLGAAIVLRLRYPAVEGWPLLALVVPVAGLAWTYLQVRTTKYRVSSRRIEIERGIFSRTVKSLELRRVLDVEYRQTLLDRITRDGRIRVVSTDRSDPNLEIHGLPESRRIFEQVRDAVEAARTRGRPLEFVDADGAGVIDT